MLLVTDSQSRLAAVVQNTDLAPGLVEGQMGLSLKMDLVPREKSIKLGDVVITSGLEADIPQGLVIGSIEKITTEPQDLFQKAILKPLVALDNLNLVTVLTR